MKLLFITTHLPPDNHFGGVVQSGNALIEALGMRLPQIKSCCVSKNPEKVIAENKNSPVCSRSILLHRWGFSPTFSRSIKPLIQEADIVAVNGIMNFPMTTAALMCIRMNKSYVVTTRGGLLSYPMRTKPLRKKIFFELFVRRILEKASAIHVTCADEYESVVSLGVRNSITIVPNGANMPPEKVDVEKELPQKIKTVAEDKKLVLFLSRIEPVKGLDILLKAWKNVMSGSKKQDKILVIAGPDERGYTDKLIQESKNLGIDKSVLFLGMVDGVRKWALYKRADIFVLPSYSENFGLVVAEALACATPVIVSTETPWQEVETWGAGRWIKPEENVLACCLSELLCLSDQQLSDMGLRGRELVQENYCWQSIADRLLTVYSSILEGKDIPLHPDCAVLSTAQPSGDFGK